MRSKRWVWVGLLLGLAIAAVSVGVALGAIGGTDTPPPVASVPNPKPQTEQPSVQARDAFAILRRDPAATDALPATAATQLANGALGRTNGMNPALARRAANDAGALWVVPGNETTCLITSVGPAGPGATNTEDPGAASCAPDSDAAKGNLVISGETGPEAHTAPRAFIAGLVPDGVDHVTITLSDAATRTLPVHDNVYATTLDNETADTVTFTGPAGTTVVHP